MLKGSSPYIGLKMRQMVASHTAPRPSGSFNPNYAPLDEAESARSQKIAADMRTKSFMGNIITRVVLPYDAPTGVKEPDDQLKYIARAQAARQAEWNRQAAMPWNNHFMVTPTDKQRLNNPAQAAAVKQRQLTIPSSYGQFYAFMHALSAAFGQLSGN